MHPKLKKLQTEIDLLGDMPEIRFRLGLVFVEQVAANLESEESLLALVRYRQLMSCEDDQAKVELAALAVQILDHANKHPGSKSIDGTRHAAVSATYALAYAMSGKAVQAAAYAAYSGVYDYGGYAVNDPDIFSEVHDQQLEMLRTFIRSEKNKH